MTPYTYTVTSVRNTLDNRVISLALIDDKAPLSSTGLVDKRLFTGETKLHAIKDPQSSLWYMQYDAGNLPPALQQRFTTFSRLLKYAEDYFKKRNIKITEIID